MRNIGSRLRESDSLIVRSEPRGCIISGRAPRLDLDVFDRRGGVEAGMFFDNAGNKKNIDWLYFQLKCLGLYRRYLLS